jgi:uncharacterized membrane protein
VFLATLCLSSDRPGLAMVAILPVLTIKEDMVLVALAFAGLLLLRRHVRGARILGITGALWALVTLGVVMPLLRGGGSDLTDRYTYLVADVNVLTAAPLLVYRAAGQLISQTLPSIGDLLLSTGFLPLLSPVSLLAAAPSMIASGLSSHSEQAGLELHYAVPSLSLLWLGVLLTLEKLRSSNWQIGARTVSMVNVAAAGLLVISLLGFFTSSPFLKEKPPDLQGVHAEALEAALAIVPADASVSAQSAILPHASSRRDVFEFPDKREGEYVIVDSGLPVSSQALREGYRERLRRLSEDGYVKLIDREGVQVWRR